MNFTGIDFSLVSDNSYAYIAFDLEYGFRLLEERRDSNAVYFRDLSDADADGISDSPITTSAIVVKSNLLDYSGSLSSLEDKIGSLIKIGDTWATILFYNNANSVTVDNYPIKLPPIQSVTPGSPGVITIPNHGLANNTPIKFSSNTMPAGMTAGTTYYVRNATTNTFTISTTSGGASIAINSSGSGELFVSKLYSVFLPTLDYDKIKDTIIGKVSRVGSTFTIESYYDVSGEAITTLELVSNLDNLIGDYEGQIVLNSQDNQVYTWNGISWIIGTGQSARSVFLTVTDQAFEYNASGNLVGTPTSTLTASVINATGVVTYDFKVDGVSVGSSASYEYTPNTLYSEMPDVVSVDVYEDGILVASDFVTMYGVLDGADATTVILSNEAHTLPASSNGDVTTYANSGTNIQVFSGITELQYVSSNPGSGEFTVIAVGTFITSGVPTTSAGKFATVPDHSNMLPGEDTAIVTYTINVEGLNTVTKVQSLTKSKQGTPGSAGIGAATAKLDATTYVITYDADDSNPSPSGTITLTAQSQNIGTPWFKFTGVGGGFDDADFSAGTGDTKTKSLTIPSSYFSTPYKIRVDVSDGDQTSLAFDSINVLAVKPGLDAITGLLTNENHTVAADSDGSNYSLGGAGGTFLVYDGVTNVTTSATFSGGTTQNGLTITIGSDGVYSLSGASWTSDSETFTLTATYKGVTITKVYTITKSKAGVIGADADYVLVTGEQSFKFLSGATAPINPTIILSAQLFGSLTTYDWEFWNTSLDIPDWQNLSAPQDAQTYSLLHSSFLGDSIRIRCISGGKFDEITIVKLYDGEDTLSGYLTNENHTVPATFSGAVTQTDLDLAGGSFKVYEGLTDVTSSASFSGNATKNGLELTINSSGVYSLSGTSWSSDTETFTLSATYKGVTITKIYTISKSKAGVDGTGSDGIVINLSNDNVTVPADFDGYNPDLTGAVTEVFIYEGTFDTTGDWNITAVASLGVSGNLVGANYTVTGLTVDSGTVTFTAAREDYADQIIVFTISKAKGGQDGSPATVYEVRPSVDVIRKSNAGAYTPTTVTFSAFSTTGSNAPTAYSGFFIIYTSTDGVTFTDRYTSSVNESFYTYTIPADIAFIKANLYLAGGTSTLLDSETIPVISDGTDGEDGSNAAAYWLTSNADVIKRGLDNTLTPSALTFTAYQSLGTTTSTLSTARWRIFVNGSEIARPPQGATATYTPTSPSTLTNVRVEMYLADDTTKVDEETIQVVQDGSNAITVSVDNDNLTFPGPVSGFTGINFGTAVSTVRVYLGSTLLNYGTSGPNTFSCTNSSNGVTVASGTGSGQTFVIPVPTDMDAETATTTVVVTVRNEAGVASTQNVLITYSLARKGNDGENAQYVLVSGEQAFKYAAGSSTPVPTSITLTASLFGGLSGYQWSYLNNGTPENITNATSPTLAVSPTNTDYFSTGINNRTFRCTSGGKYDEITIVKLFDGSNTVSGYLTNESHTVASNFDGTGYSLTGSNGIFKVFNGTNDVTEQSTFSIQSTNPVSGLTINISNTSESKGQYSLSGTSWTGTTATFTLRATYNGITIDKVYTISKSIAGTNGSNGTNARSVNLTAGTQAFVYNAAGTTTTPPPSTVVTATALNTSGTVYYEFLVNGSSVANTTTSTRTITAPSSIGNTNVEVRIREGSISNPVLARDQITIAGIQPGSNAITTILSNEAHTIPTDSLGGNGDYTGSGTTIKVFDGITPLTYVTNTTFPSIAGRFAVVISSESFITAGSIGGSGSTTATVNDASDMTENVASITYTIYVTTFAGQQVQIIKTQTFSKSRAGIDGEDGDPGGRGAGRWHIDVDAVNYASGTDGRLPLNSADAQEAWNEGVFVGTRPGNPVQGDQAWFFKGTASNPTSQNVWIYDGSLWLLQNEVIDGNLLVTGTITGDKVAANTITASKITIGDSSNMLPDWSQGSNDGWTFAGFQGWTFDGSAGAASGWRLQANGRNCGVPAEYIQITPGESYFFSAWVYNTAPETAGLLLNLRDGSTNQTFPVIPDIGESQTTLKNQWVFLRGLYTVPANIGGIVYTRARPILWVNKATTGGNSTYWTKPIMRRATDDSLVVNGSISADKLNVTQLSAITATIGTLRTAETGARTEIKDNLIEVYDSSNQLRVRLGVWT